MQTIQEIAETNVCKECMTVEKNKETKSSKSSLSSSIFSNVNIMEDTLKQKLPEFDDTSEESEENEVYKEDGRIMRLKRTRKRKKAPVVGDINMKCLIDALPSSDLFKVKDNSQEEEKSENNLTKPLLTDEQKQEKNLC